MMDDEEAIERIVLAQLLHINSTVLGIVTGLLAGFGIFFATNFLLLKGGPVVGPHLRLLDQFLIGYQITFLGSLIGFAYFFAGGFIIGYFVARIYNWLADLRESRRLSTKRS